MVRHHMKKKKGGNAGSKKQQAEKEQLEAELENLDRFAGSSEEESDEGEEDGEHMESHRDDHGESSDEEASDEDDAEDGDGITTENTKDVTHKRDADTKRVEGKKTSQTERSKESSDEESGDSSSSDDDYKDDDYAVENDHVHPQEDTSKSNGMANAMTRILGGPSALEPSSSKSKPSNTNNPIVLSKTTTPLQRLQQKIKNEEQALRQKRKDRRSENLSAMRLPLAPTAGMSSEKLTKQQQQQQTSKKKTHDRLASNAAAMAREIESERTHRRIATRGVVALFNAISKHRQAVAEEAAAREEEKARIREEGRASVKRKSVEGKGGASQTTKHGFLDMIKSAASAGGGVGGDMKESSGGGGKVDGAKGRGKGEGKNEKSGGWSALKDDFMMNSKLKVRHQMLGK